MNRRMRKALVVLMALALLPLGAMADEIVAENIEPEAVLAESAEIPKPAAVQGERAEAPKTEAAVEQDAAEQAAPEEADAQEEAPAVGYVRIAERVSVYADAERTCVQDELAAGSVVLRLSQDGAVKIAYGREGGAACGYVDAGQLLEMTEAEAASIATDGAAYYDGYEGYPLARATVNPAEAETPAEEETEAFVGEEEEQPSAERPVEEETEPAIEEQPAEEPPVEEEAEPAGEEEAEQAIEEQPAEDETEQPAGEVMEEPAAEEPVEEAVEQPAAEQPVEEPPVEEETEPAGEEEAEQAIEEQPAEDEAEQSTEEVMEEPAAEQPVEEATEQPAEEQPVEEAIEEPVAEQPSAEQPVEEPVAADPPPEAAEAQVTEHGTAMSTAPNVYSAQFQKDRIDAGTSCAIVAVTDLGAKYLLAYNEEGTRIKKWGVSYSEESDGKRTWQVKTGKISASGTVKWTFGASSGGGNIGKKKTDTLIVVPVIKSTALGASTARAGSNGSVTVKTDTGAKYLYAYDESGVKIGTWNASEYSTVADGVRTWKVIRSYPTSGNVTFTVGASAGNGYLSEKKALTMKVIAVIQSAALGASTARAGSNGSITVKTDTGAKYLYAYDESGAKIGTWNASEYSTVSGDVRTWKVIRSYPASGNVTFTVGASAGNGYLSETKALTMKVIAVIKSAALGASTARAGSNGSVTVKTDAGAKYLYAYDESGAKIGTWSASEYSTVSGDVRTWKVIRSYPASGNVTFTVGASAGNGYLSQTKALTMKVIAVIKSAALGAGTATAGSNGSVTVKTDAGAKYLYAYDESGAKIGTWSASEYSTVSGDVRTWKVIRSYPASGNVTFTVGASAGNGYLSQTKALTMTVIAKILCVTAEENEVEARGYVPHVIMTDVGAKYLYAYDGDGNKTNTWNASESSTVSGDVRTWEVSPVYKVSGTQIRTFGASAGNGRLSKTVSLAITVIPRILYISNAGPVAAGSTRDYTVRTDAGVQNLYWYDRDRALYDSWPAETYSELSGTDNSERLWDVSLCFDESGVRSLQMSAETEGLYSEEETVTLKVLPSIKSVSASSGSVAWGGSLTFTIRTDVGANRLCAYDSDGGLLETWSSACSTAASGVRTWSAPMMYTGSDGRQTIRFRAFLDSDLKSDAAGVIINVTSTSSTKYRALLVSPFNECSNDVDLMRSMLESVTGPEGGAYAIRTRVVCSKDVLLEDIDAAYRGADSDDVSLFFITTHGNTTSTGADAGALQMSQSATMKMYELADALNAVPGKVIVFIEACGSGAAIYEEGVAQNSLRKEAAAFDNAVIDAFSAVDRGLLVDAKGRCWEAGADAPKTGELRIENKFYVMTSARYQESSYIGGTYCYFPLWMSQGIGTSGAMPADADSNGVTTLHELFSYVADIGNNHAFNLSSGETVYQHTQVYPKNSGYGLFRR